MNEDKISQVRIANCLGREICYREYGDVDAPPILMVHGLGGQGLSFDALATDLQNDYRVICPDIIGRGRSQWAAEPDKEYCFSYYQALLAELLSQLKIGEVIWVGTSMGGALGIYCAGNVEKIKINALVLNDIGPEIDLDVLDVIAEAIAKETKFHNYLELSNSIAAFLGEWAGNPKDSSRWLKFALQSARRCDDGMLTLHHDPKIATQFSSHPADYQNWDRYHAVRCSVLLLRGALSEVLTESTAIKMTEVGPRAKLVTFKGCGHAPFLDTRDQIETITQFLQNDL